MQYLLLFYGLVLLLCTSASHRLGDDVIAINEKLEAHFAPENSISIHDWNRALPTTDEINEMNWLITIVLSLSNFRILGPNFMPVFFPKLAKWVTISILNNDYCIIHEHLPTSKRALFPRYWGYVSITSRNWVKRHYFHHSAPHFQSDGEVCAQAAAIYQYTRSRSLVVAGASRFAVHGRKCRVVFRRVMSPCQRSNHVADAAHNNRTMFHAINAALLRALDRDRKSIERSLPADIFFQWHGMAQTSCQMSGIFVSAGARGDHPIYSNESSISNRIVSVVNRLEGRDIAHTPRTNKRCPLSATTNIFGRLVNKVPAEDVCWQNAQQQNVTGRFIHIEQKQRFRDNWTLWEDTIKRAFPTYVFW